MRFITGFRAAAAAGAAIALLAGGDAQAQAIGAGGFSGGGAGIGVGAYAAGQGPVGARGFYGGGAPGYQDVIGFLGWGGGYGGYGGGGYGDSYVAPGGNATVYNYYYHDARRRDGGFYGGGGVFYGDDGYSRIRAVRRPSRHDDDYADGAPEYLPAPVYRPSQHIFYLPTSYRRTGGKHRRHFTQY